MKNRPPDQTTSIDLAVGFFGSVLVLFVFVAFNVSNEPSREKTPTIGQLEATVEVYPPSWSPVMARSSWALLAGERLTILDLSEISRDRFASPVRPEGYHRYVRSSEPAPNAFELTLIAIDYENLPLAWRREVLQLGENDPCPDTALDLVSVIFPNGTVGFGALLRFAGRCDFRLRFFANPHQGRLLQFPIKLASDDYLTMEGMLR